MLPCRFRLPLVLCLTALVVLLTSRTGRSANTHRGTLLLDYRGQKLEGQALSWSEANVILLVRDGRLLNIDPGAAREVRELSPGFESYSSAEMRSQLLREFGKRFEVTGTGHYLVVHPRGERDRWGERFEEMYRSFMHYFKSRGFRVQEPQFPLVAIVFPKQQDMLRYSLEEGQGVSPSVLGYYWNQSNRVALYDQGGDHQQNLDTLVHEVTHQTAYNTGIHSRYAQTPRWVVEGLGTLFEAPGVWNSRQHRAQSDRINRGRLADFRAYLKQRPKSSLQQLVARDSRFDSNPVQAYAEAWALTLFLVEQHASQYAKYLDKLAHRPHFKEYGSAARTADFTAAFGNNWALLDAHFVRFIKSLD